MPAIISSTKLRNEYNEVSRRCRESREPIFITRNGDGDLAVMSMEVYDDLASRAGLLDALAAGHADVLAGKTRPARDALADIRRELAQGDSQ